MTFETATCIAPAERVERMRDLVLAHVAADRPLAVLDVGCGTGSLVFQLADALPSASFVGVDISPANIRSAEVRRAGHGAASRITFERGDYLETAIAPVDVIVTDTALHFIRGGAGRLWTKLSGDLRPGGILVCCMADDSAYNRAIRTVRRALRRMRSAPIDFIVNRIGTMMHGRTLDAVRLKERTEYMYIPPEQLMTTAIRSDLAPSLGLQPILHRSVPSTSLTQLRQRITIFVKQGQPKSEARDR